MDRTVKLKPNRKALLIVPHDRIRQILFRPVAGPSRSCEDAEDGINQTTCTKSALAGVSMQAGSNAARITAEDCWLISKLSPSKEALP
jgi:hypothetical protein